MSKFVQNAINEVRKNEADETGMNLQDGPEAPRKTNQTHETIS